MKRLLLLTGAVFPLSLSLADPPPVVPSPAQSVVIQDPLPLPVTVDQFPEVQDVEIVAPDPLPVDIGSDNEVDVGNFPARQDVRIVDSEPLLVRFESDELRNTIYLRSVSASYALGPENITIPFDSLLEGVLVATSGTTQLGNCGTTLSYASQSDWPDGSNTGEIVNVRSPTSDEVGSSSIHVPVPGLFIAGGTTLTASISATGSIADNTCGSNFILYLRDQTPLIGGGG
jgi:hypothetical protein